MERTGAEKGFDVRAASSPVRAKLFPIRVVSAFVHILIGLRMPNRYTDTPAPSFPGYFPYIHDSRSHCIRAAISDTRPQQDQHYFLRPPQRFLRRPRIAVVVPCYTESGWALERTLGALALQQLQIANHYARLRRPDECPILFVIVIADGKDKVSSSMEEILEKLFGCRKSDFDEEAYKDAAHLIYQSVTGRRSSGRRAEYTLAPSLIPVAVHALNGDANPVYEDPFLLKTDFMLPLYCSLMVKRKNAKKHDSHEWFFCAFAQDMAAEGAFATDVGTIYGPDMLLKLWLHLKSDDRIRCA